MQIPNQTEDAVSIAELKNLARKLLSSSRVMKRLILSEPDLLPVDEIHAKLGTYSRLLYLELEES